MPDANLALISVPGEFAAAEARKALRRGLHTLIFSDNVPVEQERALRGAADRGRITDGSPLRVKAKSERSIMGTQVRS